MAVFINLINFIVYILAASLFVGLGLIIGGCMVMYEIDDELTTGLILLIVGIIVVVAVFGILTIGWFMKFKQGPKEKFEEKLPEASYSKYIKEPENHSDKQANGQIYSSPRI